MGLEASAPVARARAPPPVPSWRPSPRARCAPPPPSASPPPPRGRCRGWSSGCQACPSRPPSPCRRPRWRAPRRAARARRPRRARRRDRSSGLREASTRRARGAVAPAPAPAARARVATSESACVEAMVAMSNVRPASDATPRAGEVRALAVNRRVSASAQRGSHVAISPSTPSRVQSNPRFRVRDPRLANRAESHTSGHRWREELRRSLTGTARQL